MVIYYYSRAPSVGDGDVLYPWVGSDIVSLEWSWTTSDVNLLDYGYQSNYHKAGTIGSIIFHNDVNDPYRSGDGFLGAFELMLDGSNITFGVNDLDRTWNNPSYDEGVFGTYPDYTKTDTFRFDVLSDLFSDGMRSGNYSVMLTRVPEPATLFLFGVGLAGIAGTRIKRNKE